MESLSRPRSDRNRRTDNAARERDCRRPEGPRGTGPRPVREGCSPMSRESMAYRPLDRTSRGMTYGVLLPHFGQEASPERIIGGAVRAEHAGFDAVWVRDHLLWEPHGMEGDDPTFVEPLAVLAAIASRTSRIFLGTAVLIPVRWPLKLAQDLASLSYLAGGRVVAGLGLGSGQKELGAVGFQRAQRKKIFVETTEIV